MTEIVVKLLEQATETMHIGKKVSGISELTGIS